MLPPLKSPRRTFKLSIVSLNSAERQIYRMSVKTTYRAIEVFGPSDGKVFLRWESREKSPIHPRLRSGVGCFFLHYSDIQS